jgi:hypothetical protein
MAEELGLVFELRQALGLTSIGSIDVDRAARAKRRAEIKKERESERRRNDGSMSREEYLARSKSRTKPWEEMGISRRTYERRKARETQCRKCGDKLLDTTCGAEQKSAQSCGSSIR